MAFLLHKDYHRTTTLPAYPIISLQRHLHTLYSTSGNFCISLCISLLLVHLTVIDCCLRSGSCSNFLLLSLSLSSCIYCHHSCSSSPFWMSLSFSMNQLYMLSSVSPYCYRSLPFASVYKILWFFPASSSSRSTDRFLSPLGTQCCTAHCIYMIAGTVLFLVVLYDLEM